VTYHGWADGNVPAADSIRYDERVKLAVGGSEGITDFFRVLQWVEHGRAPEQMISSKITNGVKGSHADVFSLSELVWPSQRENRATSKPREALRSGCSRRYSWAHDTAASGVLPKNSTIPLNQS
jgi:hypothetical protein